MCVRMCAFLVCVSVCLSLCVSVSMIMNLHVCPCVFLCLSGCMTVHLCVCLYVYVCVYTCVSVLVPLCVPVSVCECFGSTHSCKKNCCNLEILSFKSENLPIYVKFSRNTIYKCIKQSLRNIGCNRKCRSTAFVYKTLGQIPKHCNKRKRPTPKHDQKNNSIVKVKQNVLQMGC